MLNAARYDCGVSDGGTGLNTQAVISRYKTDKGKWYNFRSGVLAGRYSIVGIIMNIEASAGIGAVWLLGVACCCTVILIPVNLLDGMELLIIPFRRNLLSGHMETIIPVGRKPS